MSHQIIYACTSKVTVTIKPLFRINKTLHRKPACHISPFMIQITGHPLAKMRVTQKFTPSNFLFPFSFYSSKSPRFLSKVWPSYTLYFIIITIIIIYIIIIIIVITIIIILR
jgi:hypothetical protein